MYDFVQITYGRFMDDLWMVYGGFMEDSWISRVESPAWAEADIPGGDEIWR